MKWFVIALVVLAAVGALDHFLSAPRLPAYVENPHTKFARQRAILRAEFARPQRHALPASSLAWQPAIDFGRPPDQPAATPVPPTMNASEGQRILANVGRPGYFLVPPYVSRPD